MKPYIKNAKEDKENAGRLYLSLQRKEIQHEARQLVPENTPSEFGFFGQQRSGTAQYKLNVHAKPFLPRKYQTS